MQRSRLSAKLVLTMASASAEVYEWLDADGNAHYSDRPPITETDSRSIALPPAAIEDADHEQRTLRRRRLLEASEADRAEQQQAEAEAAATKREHTGECEQVRRDVTAFERANIICATDESGARIYTTDEQRREAVADARLWLGKHCD